MSTPNLRVSVFPSMVALTVLFAVTNATALTKAAPGETNAAVPTAGAPGAKTAFANSNLTSAATVSVPTSRVLGDIRDIRQPRHFPTPWLWVGIAAGVVTFLTASYAAWRWPQRGKLLGLRPSEIALQHLAEAQRLLAPDHAREYGFAVSQIIRRYLEAAWQLHAPRLTTEEFLRELVEGSDRLAAPPRAELSDFLRHCDLAKFGGWRYSLPALTALHASAVAFVTQSAQAPAKVANTQAPPTPISSPTPKPERALVHHA